MALAQNGKVVSERHAEAKDRGLLTAGQIAQKLRRKYKIKVKAKDLNDFADEWHHSGFYKSSNGSTMGRTYFFQPDIDLDQLAKRLAEIQQEEETIAGEADVERYYFEVKFRKEYGYRGRKYWQPYADFDTILLKLSAPMPGKNRIEISREDYELMKQFDGCDLEAYESFASLKRRKLGEAA